MLQSETVKKYDKYKDSGIEWIGEIPQEWNRTKLKRLLSTPITDGPHETPELLDDGIPFLSAEAVKNNKLNFDLKRGYISPEEHLRFCKKCKPQLNDIFMIKSGATTGNVAIVDTMEEFSIWSPLALIRADENILYFKYLFYYLQSYVFKNQVELFWSYGTQQNIGMEVLGNLYIAFSKTAIEQQQIANYLDEKCGEIDRVVETEKTVIEKLKEYKQSIITEAVTKGLDKSAPLKDSGIEWIGKIPQHWKVIKLKKTISLIADIDHYMPDTTDTGYSYLMTGDLKDVASKIDFENCKHISESDYKDLSKKIHPILDDVIFARYATIGTVCYVDIQRDFLVSYSCLTIRPDSEKLFGKFLYYYLMSDTFKIEVSQYINSNTQSNVGLDSLQKVYMVLPDKNEQQQIAKYLDKKCSEIDKAIADKEQVIEKFTEYKKSLIYECVTGKRKVVA